MVDHSKGLWMAAKVCEIEADNPEMIVLKSTHKKNPKRFFVNKAVLRYYSTYFKKICNGDRKEGCEGKTEFEVDIPQRVLRLLHGWLSKGIVLTDFEADVLLKLHVYGDYIGCLALRRAVISHLQKVSKTSDGSVNIISYQSLHDNGIWTEHQTSGLYRFIVDTFAFHWHHELDDSPAEANFNIPQDIPIKFAYDQLVIRTENQHAIGRGIGVGDCRCCSSVCKYHEHLSDEERLATCGADFGRHPSCLADTGTRMKMTLTKIAKRRCPSTRRQFTGMKI